MYALPKMNSVRSLLVTPTATRGGPTARGGVVQLTRCSSTKAIASHGIPPTVTLRLRSRKWAPYTATTVPPAAVPNVGSTPQISGHSPAQRAEVRGKMQHRTVNAAKPPNDGITRTLCHVDARQCIVRVVHVDEADIGTGRPHR